MHRFGSGAASSAGQRTSESPNYTPSRSPRPSRFVTLHLPPGLLQAFPKSGDGENEETGENGEEESLDESSEDDFGGRSIEEVYDNGDKKFFYESDEEWDIVDRKEYDSRVVWQSIEHDEENDGQIVGQSIDGNEDQSDDSDARGGSATQSESPENLVNLPTSKLLASCLDTDQSFLYDYLAQRSALAVAFLERNHNILEQFLTQHPDFVLKFLRRNQQQARALFIEDPTWYVEQHLNKYPYLLENYMMEHPESVEKFISGNPKYFDQYLIRHPEFAINYLHYNRLPSGFGIPPEMFGVTSVTTPPPQPSAQTPSPTSAGLPSPDSSPLPPPPPPPPPPPADKPGRKSTIRKPQAIRKPPTKPAGRAQQSLPKATSAEAGPKTKQQLPKPVLDPVSAPVPASAKVPITPDSGPKKTAGPSPSKMTIGTALVPSSNDSAQAQTYKILLTSTYGQTAGQFMSYPAPANLLAASRKQDAGTKGSWRLFEEDRAIKHMFDVRDEALLAGETRFEEVSTRLKAEGIERGFFAVKNYWNRTGRARSGFDERKNKTAPLATSKQGKAFRQNKKAKGERKKKRGKDNKVQSDGEEDEDDEDDSEYSVHSEEEDTPPPPRRPPPPPPPSPPPQPPPPPPVTAPAPAPQKSALKRKADHDDEALAWAMSRGTRPKKQRPG